MQERPYWNANLALQVVTWKLLPVSQWEFWLWEAFQFILPTGKFEFPSLKHNWNVALFYVGLKTFFKIQLQNYFINSKWKLINREHALAVKEVKWHIGVQQSGSCYK